MPDFNLKAILSSIAATDYKLTTSVDLDSLLTAMLACIGDPDPELRDELIYTTLVRWAQSGLLQPPQLERVYTAVLDDQHLYYRLGEYGTRSVLTRSFSSLALAMCVYMHRKEKYLGQDKLLTGLERLLAYLPSEQDRRGYLSNLGWAHAVAHAADALDEYALCTEVERGQLGRILDSLGNAAAYSVFPYAHEEDERLSVATVSVIRRGLLSNSELADWLEGLNNAATSIDTPPENMYLRQNLKRFLRSVYFRLKRPEHQERINLNIRQVFEDNLSTTLQELIRY